MRDAFQEFLVGLFGLSKPSEKAANSVTVREVLDNGADRIQRDLREQPQVAARLLSTMGEAYYSLGLYQRAKALQEQALELQRRLHGPHSTEVATALMSLSLTLERQGEYRNAEHAARQYSGDIPRTCRQPGIHSGCAYYARSSTVKRQGRYLDAERAVPERRIACICHIPGVPDLQGRVVYFRAWGVSCSRNQTSPAPKKQVARHWSAGVVRTAPPTILKRSTRGFPLRQSMDFSRATMRRLRMPTAISSV